METESVNLCNKRNWGKGSMHDKRIEKTVRKALQSVAKMEGVSVERVRREIDMAIAAARRNDDPAVHALWKAMLAKDTDSSTAESIVAHFARMDMDGEN